jgi:hypothetical protein
VRSGSLRTAGYALNASNHIPIYMRSFSWRQWGSRFDEGEASVVRWVCNSKGGCGRLLSDVM